MFLKTFITVVATNIFISINCKAQTTVVEPDPIQEKTLLNPNPISYTFSIPLNKLRDTIIKMFDIDPQMDDQTLEKIFYYNWPETGDIHKNQVIFTPQTSGTDSFGMEYFKNPATKDDVFLTQMADYWYSPKYYHKSKPFEFTASYAIHFDMLDSNSTTITIKPVDAEIFNGTLCCSPHGNYSNTQSVASTSVEEYTLILYIAEKLGVKGLKPLELPK